MRRIDLKSLALDADEPKCAVCGSNVEEAQGYSRKAWCSECGKLQPMREKQNVWGPTKAKDDREYPMPVHRLTGRNPDRCAQCGRPQSDLIHNYTNRFATDRRAKDQVPQDCFDAQILGV